MTRLHFHLPLRQRLLLGLTTIKNHCPRKQYWSMLLAAFILMLLPWACVVVGMVASWQTYAAGDEMQVPAWAWAALVVLPILAWLLAKMMAGRICTQLYIRKSVRR